ncbi:tRNA (guanine(46)-N(7))-methyltransferase TrmB [Roseomonas sp. OT10]|uniref:tRNA (guanine(46)-N(7))-methyltransferase TrmB n=1 Tax=Roseomonas cutis TaxID=2897332 RepID=UPI001E53A532|nr:tRNA (guanine(46)-N(7))-methyltransferase TrmB [Roseomonas sp. OT10]UFN49915.1 tRNA (guanine(46)-N(7))-methyltransferase TrmB [Roseomonas sp. OT10]
MTPDAEPGAHPPAPGAPEGGPPAVPDRLYGRRRGHPLRVRQQRLLEAGAPRLSLDPARLDDPAAAFATRPAALWLEIGFGGGEHAEALARANPGVGLIAAEVFENGICSLLSRLLPEGEEATAPGLPNLRLWTRDARHLLAALPEGALDRLYLMFPDPWPKARHAKRRFVHPATLPLVARALRPGGEWRIASDHLVYQGWVEEVMGAQALFEPVSDSLQRPADGFPTRYEAKAHREGRTPRYWSFRRR